MDPAEPKRTRSHDLAPDLKAAVRARRELDDDMEDHVLDAFLARLEQRMDAHVDQRAALSQPVQRVQSATTGSMVAVVAGSFALSIPLLGIAAASSGTVGILIVMAALAFVNLLYFVDRWQ